MLQQTQALRVIPKWHEFMTSYPSPSDCAEASLGDVLRLWQGLGYPRRARNLHASATRIAALDQFPSTLDALLQLPGVGEYTARAVLAFAFEADAAVVDTNIARVLARLAGRRLTAKQAQAAADAVLPSGDSWAWNQCLMDLGAVLCRPTSPGCAECPLQGQCSWRGFGNDPSIGSAGVSTRQARFAGSDRQARGRLMNALADGPVPMKLVAAVMACDAARAARLAGDLQREDLVVQHGQALQLPC
ncbi:MAG: A/G-specific adenine glycosylase [Ilumatobacteraceae bacterium]|nr:A/G-specific adenine glycosylase [Ilumatobacteraceae bacterium]